MNKKKLKDSTEMVNVESYIGYLYLRFTGLSEGFIHIYAATEDLNSLRIEPVTFLIPERYYMTLAQFVHTYTSRYRTVVYIVRLLFLLYFVVDVVHVD